MGFQMRGRKLAVSSTTLNHCSTTRLEKQDAVLAKTSILRGRSHAHGDPHVARVIVRRRDSRRDVIFKLRADVGSGDRRPASGLDFLDPLPVAVIVEARHRQRERTGHGDQAILDIPLLRVGVPLRAAQLDASEHVPTGNR